MTQQINLLRPKDRSAGIAAWGLGAVGVVVFSPSDVGIVSGSPVYALETTGRLIYRSNRITDLYTPPGK